jgi:hypothetical protein
MHSRWKREMGEHFFFSKNENGLNMEFFKTFLLFDFANLNPIDNFVCQFCLRWF